MDFSGNGSQLYDWPAWWISGPNWPASGENDIAEVLGGALTVNYHSPSGSHNQGAPAGYWGGGFHVYGLMRNASSVDVYWDGKLVKSYPTDDNGVGEQLIFNIGSGQGSPVAYGAASQLKVDYVHVYSNSSSAVAVTPDSGYGGPGYTGGGGTPPPPLPVVTGSGSDTLVLAISEDAYANGDGTSDANGDAAFTVSVDGKQLAGTFYATASHSAGASQNFTFEGNWAPGAHTVAVDFLNDAYAGTPSTDRNLYVNDVTYDGTDTKQSAALMSAGSQTFRVTDDTPIPPVVTGGGSDSLLIKVSEDYYLANAQFTVSVDGKELGGTFTATALQSAADYGTASPQYAADSQTFAFAGDFGSGQHTVSVDFLNDAYAGTPATDRNLYVNDIVYNGTDTEQSAALMSQGAKTFSVSGGTAPSVSETGDHGSLQKNLSQTGTYTVGGDTFVLGSGNADTVTLGTGTSQIKFVGSSSVTLTGGSGQATVTADAGNNKFVAGAGSLDVTGGAGNDAYVFHSTSGLLTLEDFSLASDTLTVDKSLQGSLHEASDGVGGTMLSFGAAGQGVDIHGLATLPSSNILWA